MAVLFAKSKSSCVLLCVVKISCDALCCPFFLGWDFRFVSMPVYSVLTVIQNLVKSQNPHCLTKLSQ